MQPPDPKPPAFGFDPFLLAQREEGELPLIQWRLFETCIHGHQHYDPRGNSACPCVLEHMQAPTASVFDDFVLVVDAVVEAAAADALDMTVPSLDGPQNTAYQNSRYAA